jgi:UDP-N-acetyl-D-mannosaminuronate dehydrogenase
VVIGVGYKAGVDDLRNAPSLAILGGLRAAGVLVRYCDPLVPALDVDGVSLTSTPCDRDLLAGSDLAILVSPTADLLRRLDLDAAPQILDTCHVLPPVARVRWF